MKKYFFSMIMLLLLYPLTGKWTVHAQSSGFIGDTKWEYDGEGLLTIGGTTFIGEHFLDNSAFDHFRNGLRHVVIEHGVTNIGTYAFQSTFIETITLPATYNVFDIETFENCWALTSIIVNDNNPLFYSGSGALISSLNDALVFCPVGKTGTYYVPESVKILDKSAFYNCTMLDSIILPDGLQTIKSLAFLNCGVISVTIPSSVTTVENQSFYLCNNLKYIHFPASATKIYPLMFPDCNNLEFISVDNDHPAYISIDGVLLSKDMSSLYRYPPGKKGAYSVPVGTKFINTEAFLNCKDLTSVIISSTVISIASPAFQGCTSLVSVTFPESLPAFMPSVFNDCLSIEEVICFRKTPPTISFGGFPPSVIPNSTLRVPATSLESYGSTNIWKDFKEILPIEEKIKLDYVEIYLLPGGMTTLKAEITGGAANPKSVSWNSNHQQVATVNNNGNVMTLNPGTTVITASSGEEEVECTVSVITRGKMFVNMSGTKIEREKLYIK